MFSAHCPVCNGPVLLSWSRLRSLANTPLGIELAFDCWCGTRLEVLTGRTADEPVYDAA